MSVLDEFKAYANPDQTQGQQPQPEQTEQSVLDAFRSYGRQEPAPADYERRSRKAGLSVGRTPQEQEEILRKRGFSAEAAKQQSQQYQVEQTQQNLGRFEGGRETMLGSAYAQLAPKTLGGEQGRAVPFRDWFVNDEKAEAEARKRLMEGKPTDADYRTIAMANRKREDEKALHDAGPGGEVLGAIRGAPALFGEYLTGMGAAKALKIGQAAKTTVLGEFGSHAARMGVVTATSPGMYMNLARQKNLENGRESDDWRGLPPALAHTYAQLLVLGRVFEGAQGAKPGLLAGTAGALKGGVTGATESAIATSLTNLMDKTIIPDAYKISTGYGTFEKLMTGDVSGAARKFGTDALTFAALGGMHRLAEGFGPKEAAKTAKETVEVLAKDVATLKGKGFSEESAYNRVNEQNEQILNFLRNLPPDQQAAYWKYHDLRKSGVSHVNATRAAFLGEPSLSGGPKAIGPGEPPPEALPPGPDAPVRPGGPPALEGPRGPEAPAGPEIVAPERSGASEKPTEAPERYYRTPDSKGSEDNVDAAVRELVGDQFAGKWFSRTFEGNAGYKGHVQLEFRNDRLGGPKDAVERQEKDVLIGGETPMYMHPALEAIRYRGPAEGPQFQKVKEIVDVANAERAKVGRDPIELLTGEGAKKGRATPKKKAVPKAETEFSLVKKAREEPEDAPETMAPYRAPGEPIHEPGQSQALGKMRQALYFTERHAHLLGTGQLHGMARDVPIVMRELTEDIKAYKNHMRERGWSEDQIRSHFAREFPLYEPLVNWYQRVRENQRGAAHGNLTRQRAMEELANSHPLAAHPSEHPDFSPESGWPTAEASKPDTRSFTRRFFEEEGGYLDLQRLKDLFNQGVTLAKDWLSSIRSGKPPSMAGVRIDMTNPMPRMPPNNEFKKTVSDPQGAGQIPILRSILDPLRADTSPESEVFVANQAMKEIGKNFASLWAVKDRVADKLFGADETGTYLRGNGTRGYKSDDIEAEMLKPGSQTYMSPEQRAWIHNEWTPLLRDAQKMMREEGVADWVDAAGNPLSPNAKAYFPRSAIGKANVPEASSTGTGGRPGAKATHEKARQYKSEQEGANSADKIVYDPSAKSQVAKFIADVYRVVADKRMADDPALKGEKIIDRYNRAVAANATWLATLPPAVRADVLAEMREQAAHPKWGVQAKSLAGPAFAGKIFPKEIADQINKQFHQEQSEWMKTTERVSAAAKGMMLGGDLSFLGIQLLPTLMTKPIVWAKAVRESISSIWNPERLSQYLEAPENANAARELVQLGSSIGRLQDFMSGLGKGEFATKLPVVGKIYESTGRAFGVAMDVAKIELWKAWSKTAQPHELRNVAEAIDSMLLTGRMEGIGLSPQRMMLERLSLLASSYYRGGINLVGTAFQRGTAGYIARKALGATIAGILIATVAAMKAAGLSDDEIEERLNPASGKFLKVPIDLGEGKKVEVGTSNILTSYVRLMGAAADHFSSDKPVDTGVDGNPILRWLRGKAAFAPRLAIDLATGKDYFGNRIEPQEAVVRSFEPLLVQQLMHGEGGVTDKGIRDPRTPAITNVADALVSVFGLSSYPGSSHDAKYAFLNDEAKKKYGRDYDSLSIPEQAQVVKSAAKRPDMPVKPPATSQQMERAMALQQERQTRITKMVSDESRDKLTSLNKQLPAYLGTISVSGEEVPLGRARMGRYEKLLAEEYDQAIEKWKLGDLKLRSADARDDYMRRTLSDAKERAKQRLINESR